MRVPRRRSFLRAAAAALALGALATTAVPAAADGPGEPIEAASHGDLPTVVGFDFGYKGVPERLPTGTYDFNFANTSRTEFHEIVLFRLGRGDRNATVEEVVEAADTEDESFFRDFRGFSVAEPRSVQEPRHSEEFGSLGQADLSDPGRYLYICFITTDGVPHYKLDPGMLGFINVR